MASHKKAPIEKDFLSFTGHKWVESSNFRLGLYQSTCILTPVSPDDVLAFADKVLQLFKEEKNDEVKSGLLTLLNSKLSFIQEKTGHLIFVPFYKQLAELVWDGKHTAYVPELLTLGLNVAYREKTPSSYYFIASSIEYIDHYGVLRHGPAAITPILDKLDSVLCANPELIDPKYIETCCRLIRSPFRPSQKKHEAENAAIKNMHFRASDNLINVVRRFNNPALAYLPQELFAKDTYRSLRYMAKRAVDWAASYHVIIALNDLPSPTLRLLPPPSSRALVPYQAPNGPP